MYTYRNVGIDTDDDDDDDTDDCDCCCCISSRMACTTLRTRSDFPLPRAPWTKADALVDGGSGAGGCDDVGAGGGLVVKFVDVVRCIIIKAGRNNRYNSRNCGSNVTGAYFRDMSW